MLELFWLEAQSFTRYLDGMSMTFRPLDAVLGIVAIGAGIAAVGAGHRSLAMMSEDVQAEPQNSVPEGHTIYGDINTDKYQSGTYARGWVVHVCISKL